MIPAATAPELLSSLLSDVDAESPAAARRVRQLLARSGGAAFAAAAARALESMPDTPARRFLLSLLEGNGLLLDCLADRRLETRRAVELARLAAACDSQTDVRLARQLAEAASSRRLDDGALLRLLEVLEALIETPRAALPLNPFLTHPNPRIRSKAALLIGRAARTGRWVGRQLASPDGRVRANAVEALWGGDPDVCAEVFRDAVRDPNCRVAGNAAVGQYLLGDPASVALLVTMFAHPSPEFRATAAWCMGRTGDPRFLGLLQSAVRESRDGVHQNVLRAISCIRRNAARIEAAGRLQVEAVPAGFAPDGMRRLRVAVAGGNAAALAGLAPTCFSVREGGGIVTDYRVTEIRPPGALVVGFALPRGVDAGDPLGSIIDSTVAESARHRRRHDPWGFLDYAVEEPMAEPEPDRAPAFSDDPAAVRERAGQAGGRQSLWPTVGRLLRAASAIRGSRHIVLVGDPDRSLASGQARDVHALESAAAASDVSIHAVWGGADAAGPLLPGLVERTGGRWVHIDSIDEIPTACARIALGLLARYEIAYRTGTVPGAPARVRVHCESGCGESGRLEIA
jgi:hypothetical protein